MSNRTNDRRALSAAVRRPGVAPCAHEREQACLPSPPRGTPEQSSTWLESRLEVIRVDAPAAAQTLVDPTQSVNADLFPPELHTLFWPSWLVFEEIPQVIGSK
jgi:hypothetical protein